MTVEKTLAERGSRYGSFETHASIAQSLQEVMRAQPGWNVLADDQRQALTVVADKIARVLNGDPNYPDNWHDIQGYAKLVEDRLNRDAERAALGAELPFAVQHEGAFVDPLRQGAVLFPSGAIDEKVEVVPGGTGVLRNALLSR